MPRDLLAGSKDIPEITVRPPRDLLETSVNDSGAGANEYGSGINRLNAGINSVAQGLTFGLSDEIEAGLSTGFGLLGNYDEALQGVRGRQEQLRSEFPVTSIAGEIGGGIATGGGLARSGATMLGRGSTALGNVGRGAAEGAVYGAAYGYGTGEGGASERAKEALVGAGTGAALGGAVSGVGAGINAARGARGANQRTAAQAAVNEADQFGIPLSRGQATGDVAQQAFEQEALHGARGNVAGERAREFAARQRQAVTDAGEGIATQVGGGNRIVNTGQEAADVVSGAVRDRAGNYRRGAGAAFRAAEAGDATIAAAGLPKLSQQVTAALDGEIIPDSFGTLRGAVQKVDDLVSLTNAPKGQGDVVGVNWKEVERVRRGISAAKGSTPDEMRLMGKVRKAFDAWLDDAVDNALLDGDPKTIESLKEGRSLWSQYRSLAPDRPKSAPDRLFRKIVDEDASATEITNALFGVSQVGAKGDSVRLAQKLRKEFGMDSEPMNAIRQAAVIRLMERAKGGDQKGYQALATDITEFLDRSGRDWARVVFKPEQIKEMRRFAQIVKQLPPDATATNPSKSAYTMKRLAGNAFQSMASMLGLTAAGPAGLAAGPAVGAMGAAAGAVKAGRAFGAPVPATAIRGPAGTGGGVGALADQTNQVLIGP